MSAWDRGRIARAWETARGTNRELHRLELVGALADIERREAMTGGIERHAEAMANAIDMVREWHFSPDENTFNPSEYLVLSDDLAALFRALEDYDEWVEGTIRDD